MHLGMRVIWAFPWVPRVEFHLCGLGFLHLDFQSGSQKMVPKVERPPGSFHFFYVVEMSDTILTTLLHFSISSPRSTKASTKEI